MTAVAVASGVEGLDLSVQKPLFTHDAFGKDDYTYAVSGDGQRFLVNAAGSDPSQPIVVVLNWAAGLKGSADDRPRHAHHIRDSPRTVRKRGAARRRRVGRGLRQRAPDRGDHSRPELDR